MKRRYSSQMKHRYTAQMKHMYTEMAGDVTEFNVRSTVDFCTDFLCVSVVSCQFSSCSCAISPDISSPAYSSAGNHNTAC